MTDPIEYGLLAEGALGAFGWFFFMWLVTFSPTMRVPFNESRRNFRGWFRGRYSVRLGEEIEKPAVPTVRPLKEFKN